MTSKFLRYNIIAENKSKFLRFFIKVVKQMTQQLISFKEAQNFLGFKSSASLREYIQQGLPVVTVGKSKRIDIDDLKKFIQDHKTVKQSN